MVAVDPHESVSLKQRKELAERSYIPETVGAPSPYQCLATHGFEVIDLRWVDGDEQRIGGMQE